MHTMEKKNIDISAEEIFLPTSPDTLEEEKMKKEREKLDYEPLPSKPEDLE